MFLFSYPIVFILWLLSGLLCLWPTHAQASLEHLHQEARRALLNQMNEMQLLPFPTPSPPITATCTMSKLVEHPVSPIWFIASPKPLLLPHPLQKADPSLLPLNASTTCPDAHPTAPAPARPCSSPQLFAGSSPPWTVTLGDPEP